MAKNNEYVKKRKSYYGFAKNYPGKLGSSKYVIGESKIVRRNETIRKIVIAIIVIFLFIASYVITSVGFNISNKEPQNKTTAVSVSDTAVVLLVESGKWKVSGRKNAPIIMNAVNNKVLPKAGSYIVWNRSFPLPLHFYYLLLTKKAFRNGRLFG